MAATITVWQRLLVMGRFSCFLCYKCGLFIQVIPVHYWVLSLLNGCLDTGEAILLDWNDKTRQQRQQQQAQFGLRNFTEFTAPGYVAGEEMRLQ